MRDREPQPLRREGEPPTVEGTCKLRSPLLARTKAVFPTTTQSYPRARARRGRSTSRRIGDRFRLAFDVGGNELAVIAGGKNPLAVAGRGEDRARCALIRASLPPAIRISPAPVANAALSPTKWIATTWLPASIACTFDVSEAFSTAWEPGAPQATQARKPA